MNYSFLIIRNFFFAAFAACSPLLSKEAPPADPYAPYFKLIEEGREALGQCGNWQNGEIEVIADRDKMGELEAASGRKVGLVAQDKYWVWVNDAVRFPGGGYGVYGRMLWTSVLKGGGGVAVMCVTADGKVVLNCNYRHATRSWELELPRGGREPGESVEAAAGRELLEETGMIAASFIPLGEMAPDTGVLSTVVPVLLARSCKRGAAMPEASEAIIANVAFEKEALYRALREGTVTVTVGGRQIKACVRDPFLTFALLQAQLRGCY